MQQTRRSAVVAGVLSVAMVAGVALAYMQPSRVEMVAKSTTASADATLEAELIKAAPTATVSLIPTQNVCQFLFMRKCVCLCVCVCVCAFVSFRFDVG